MFSMGGVCVCVCVCVRARARGRAKLLQSRRIIGSPMDYSSPGSYVRDFSGKKTGVGFHALLQGIFPTRGLNPVSRGCCTCRWASLALAPPAVCSEYKANLSKSEAKTALQEHF